ncbi:hypothetical protein NEF87_004819 [Candidatus Lokiarchaeum ossiferum]|uniref:HEAT repeat domain-containing protein n=1 Tax=Candidatus Lokiarchaeum ossiferum TaxID=2951803 RepID=A0ABY6HYC9_9ARCH|nr:hypothetical protein NEF87_004819 [Candidatus Lokiarchaeum sp. B-35]
MTVIDKKSIENAQTLEYIKQIVENSQGKINSVELKQIMIFLVEDLHRITSANLKTYLDDIIEKIPSECLPFFFEALHEIEDEGAIHKMIIFFIRSNKPLYCMIGVQLIQKIHDESYTGLIAPFIYSNHKPLRQLTIRCLLANPGNIENILEQNLSDRNPKRRELTENLIFQINPKNIKVAQKKLNNTDFLERIQAISTLAETQDRKLVSKFETMLDDPDISVRKAVIEGITRLGGKKARKILKEHLLKETHFPLRALIISNFK